jgi:extracellular factor (EF) 3-hydroxypalmitic acid methyl ester biosynthesis protein
MTEMPPPKLVTAIRTYEELEGAQGREVFFRPQRYRAQDLAPLRAYVNLRIDLANYECPVHDVSQNGVAFEWPPDIPVEVGSNIERLEVCFDEHVAYRGDARVGSLRAETAPIAGVSFTGPLLDVDLVLHVRDIKAWQGRDGLGLTLSRKAWAVEGNDRFKTLVSELALYLQDSEGQLGELEKSLAWHVVQGESPSAAREALLERLRSEFVTDVVRYSNAINDAMDAAPPAHLKSLREYTRRLLHGYIMQAPWMHRAYYKPFGYPGDYEVMMFVYERDFEGATLFGKAVGYAFLQTKAALAVKFRKELIKEQLRTRIQAHRGIERPLRILSVASGPGQELYELLRDLQGEVPPLEIVLFDQDKGALSYAYRRLKPMVDERFRGAVQILYLHESIKRLLRDSDLFAGFGLFDAIYTSGLYDYLQTTTSVVLTRNLYARIGSGGTLYIGNMAPENLSRWFMEFHLDWFLIHRTRAQLSEIGMRGAPDCHLRVLEEESGVNPFIAMTKQ